ncbi:glycine zipper 2TM domain-containing protein [Kaarinaea lacus]
MNNSTKTILALTTSLALIFSANASAEHKRNSHRGESHIQYAKVVHAEPIYKTVRVAYPEQVCWREEFSKPIKRRVSYTSPEAMLMGGVIGGVIGHELGKNHNQGISTVAGALIGTAIASEANAEYYRTGEYRIERRQQCRTEQRYRTEQHLKGYRVTYRYKGELYTTRTKYHPGKRIPVNVEVTPIRRHH